MADEADLAKAELRTRMRAALRSMDAASRAEESTRIRAAIRVWPQWAGAKVVMPLSSLLREGAQVTIAN